MSGILDLLQGEKGKKLIDGISEKVNITSEETSSVVKTAIPLLMGAMQKKTGDEQGAMGLLNSLKNKDHNGSLIDNLGSLFGGNESDEKIEKEGSGILENLLGGNQSTIENAVSKRTGVSSSLVSKILKLLTPVLMSFIGKKVADNKVDSAGGLSSMLSGFLGSSGESGMLNSILDSNGDGSVFDDVKGMVFGSKDEDKKDKDGILGKFF